jgi:hypothetical protein
MDAITLTPLYEHTDITTENSFQIIKESVSEGSDPRSAKLRIRGPYIMADAKNRNGRIYPRHIMEREVKKYKTNFIDTKSSIGELSHPYKKELMTEINLERGCHLIEELDWDGDNAIGTSRVLEELPMGRIVKAYLNEGITLGVSTRGFGTVGNNNTVDESYKFKTVDVVHLPSAQVSYVECIRENYDFIIGSTGDDLVEKAVKEFEAELSSPNKDLKLALLNFIGQMRNSKGL